MVSVQITLPKHLNVPSFSRQEMLNIGGAAVKAVKSRIAQGVGLNDRRMKKLSPSYAKLKRKRGAEPIRNLMFNGGMQSSMTIVEVDQNRVVVGFTNREALAKAVGNQNRVPWFGLSKTDQEYVNAHALRLMKARKLD